MLTEENLDITSEYMKIMCDFYGEDQINIQKVADSERRKLHNYRDISIDNKEAMEEKSVVCENGAEEAIMAMLTNDLKLEIDHSLNIINKVREDLALPTTTKFMYIPANDLVGFRKMACKSFALFTPFTYDSIINKCISHKLRSSLEDTPSTWYDVDHIFAFDFDAKYIVREYLDNMYIHIKLPIGDMFIKTTYEKKCLLNYTDKIDSLYKQVLQKEKLLKNEAFVKNSPRDVYKQSCEAYSTLIRELEAYRSIMGVLPKYKEFKEGY